LWSALGKAAKLGKAGKAAGAVGGAAIVADTLTALRRLAPDSDVRRLALGFDEDGVARLADTTGGEWTVRNFGELDDLAWQSAMLKDAGSYRRIELYVRDDQLFSHQTRLAALPENLDLHIVHRRKDVYPVRRGSEGDGLQVEARPDVLVDAANLRDLDQILFRLERVLNRAALRLLKVVPDSAQKLPSLPDRVVARAPEPQAIDPSNIAQSLRALRGQTAVLTGRIENSVLLTQTRRGGKITRLPIAEIRAAARDADINLIILDTNVPLQPGVGGLLGKRRSKTLDAAFQANTHGEFLAALARHDAPINLRVESNGSRHVAISSVDRRPDVEMNPGESAHIEHVVHGIHLLSRTREFEEEHDLRLVWWLPSYVVVGLIVNFVAGVLAWGIAYGEWWARIWPPPAAHQWFRRKVAGAARSFVFFGLFLPLFGGMALVWMVLRVALIIVLIPVRLATWIRLRVSLWRLSRARGNR